VIFAMLGSIRLIARATDTDARRGPV
jgi:hypothetical protein